MTAFNINDQFNELVKVTLSKKQQLTEPTDKDNIQQEMIDKSAKSPDLFQDHKLSERKHIATRRKLRNILSNIAYVEINKEDFYNENFIFDVYLLVTKILIPFLLER